MPIDFVAGLHRHCDNEFNAFQMLFNHVVQHTPAPPTPNTVMRGQFIFFGYR